MNPKLVEYLMSMGAPPSVIDRLVAKMESRSGVQPIQSAGVTPRGKSPLHANPVGRQR
jgi:hypothetical protein